MVGYNQSPLLPPLYYNIKGSASQLNKLVLKALIYRNAVVLIFFPGLVINTYNNFQKTLPRAVSATTRCKWLRTMSGCEQRVIAKCNEWLQTTSDFKQRVVAGTARGRVFWKFVYVLMTRPGKKISTTDFYLWGLSLKTNLFNCEADPLSFHSVVDFHSRL